MLTRFAKTKQIEYSYSSQAVSDFLEMAKMRYENCLASISYLIEHWLYTNIAYWANGMFSLSTLSFTNPFIVCSSNALPLIPRGQYIHLSGYNKGQPYTLLDFYQVLSKPT